MPGAYRLLDARKGDRVLDLACGQGVFSRYLCEKGVVVEGLDVSDELVRMASARSDKRIRFHVADAGDPNALPGQQFDAVVCLLAAQNMKNLAPVFANVARWLKPEGHFVMVTTHPCFRIPRQSHWGWDEERKIQYRRTDHYLSEIDIPILTPPMAMSDQFTLTSHRPLQSYFRALSASGMWVEVLAEWTSNKLSQPGPRSRAENRARKEIPLFLALRARPSPR